MPVYDFKCQECGKRFSVTLKIEERSRARIKCPKCESRKVEQQYTSVYAVTSRKS